MLNVNDWRAAARRTLPRFVYEYVDGAAEDERCLARNRSALDAVSLTPRVLRDTRRIDPKVSLFGQTWAQPFAIAPTGLNGLIRPGGDLMGAAAAQTMGVPFVLSTASNERLEAVREAAPQAQLWLQLYVMEDRSVAEQLLRRAKAAKFSALVLTVDVPVSGLREKDLRNGFKVPFKPSLPMAIDLMRHPAWSLRQAMGGGPKFVNLVEDTKARMSAQAQAALLARAMDRGLDWYSLSWLRRHWAGPLLVKGVLHPDDARRAARRCRCTDCVQSRGTAARRGADIHRSAAPCGGSRSWGHPRADGQWHSSRFGCGTGPGAWRTCRLDRQARVVWTGGTRTVRH